MLSWQSTAVQLCVHCFILLPYILGRPLIKQMATIKYILHTHNYIRRSLYLQMKKKDKAKQVLIKLRGTEDVTSELTALEIEEKKMSNIEMMSILQVPQIMLIICGTLKLLI